MLEESGRAGPSADARDDKKRNGKGSECVFISMSGFLFLFSVKGESAWQVLRLRSLRMTIKGADGSTAAHHDKVAVRMTGCGRDNKKAAPRVGAAGFLNYSITRISMSIFEVEHYSHCIPVIDMLYYSQYLLETMKIQHLSDPTE